MSSCICSNVMPVWALISLICVRIAGSSLIRAHTFAPCVAKPFRPATKLTQNAVLPLSGLAKMIRKLPSPIPFTLSRKSVKLYFHFVLFYIFLEIFLNITADLNMLVPLEFLTPEVVVKSTCICGLC